MPDAKEIYSDQLRRLAARDAALSKKKIALSLVRFAMFLTAVASFFGALNGLSAGWPMLLAAIVVFSIAASVHQRAFEEHLDVVRRIAFFRRGMARLENRWQASPLNGAEFMRGSNSLDGDLDLFGEGSLFALLCADENAGGRARLAEMIRSAPGADEIERRQEGVRELAGLLELRVRLAVESAGLHKKDPAADLRAPPVRIGGSAIAATSALAALSVAGICWRISGGAWTPFLAVLAAQLLLYRFLKKQLDELLSRAERMQAFIGAYGRIIAILEQQTFASGILTDLQRQLRTDGALASARMRSLQRRIDWLISLRSNLAALPLTLVAGAHVHLSKSIEEWRAAHQADLDRWLDAIHWIVALGYLGGRMAEDPTLIHPTIEREGAVFVAEQMGHPLLPAERCVGNDLHLDGGRRVLIVSGSNMGGKSTFLRAAGVNAALARMGAGVRARRMRIAPFELGACIHHEDSLQRGMSRFYTEITRIKAILDASKEARPLLVLIDEIFGGTNSHDRAAATAAILRNLRNPLVLGLISTHDLAICSLADEIPGAENIHFADRIENGRLVFDYKIKPGPAGAGNAIELMRSIGIEI